MKNEISRRDFVKASGALVVCFSSPALIGPLAMGQGPFDTHQSHIDPEKLDSWLAVASDGKVTAYTGKCDLGQGMYTVQTQLVAEELCVSINKVTLIQCDTSVTPDQGTTSGSQSTPANFNTQNLAQAAATAREALVGMAAQRLGVSVDQLSIENGVVSAKSGRHVSYDELVGGRHFDITVSSTAKRRSPSEWRILGKAVPSMDRVALVTGTFEFVHNVHVPGMVHGRVVRPPEIGAAVTKVDEKSVQHVTGLIKVVVRNNFVGVVAEKQWQAAQAAKDLKVTWKPVPTRTPAHAPSAGPKEAPAKTPLKIRRESAGLDVIAGPWLEMSQSPDDKSPIDQSPAEASAGRCFRGSRSATHSRRARG
jgi:CO/xanthine dehydrogenase Mo-binding subunit